MKIFLFISILFLANFSLSEKTTYDGYKLVILSFTDKALIGKVHSFEGYDPEYDVWGVRKVGDEYSITVMLSPKVVQKYLNIFKSIDVNFKIAHHNVQALLDYQDSVMMKNKADKPIFEKFARYPEIENFVKDIAANYSDFVSTYYAGSTVENRRIIVAKFKTDKTASSKRALWIDCGIHAREWVTPATCTYIINRLVTEYKAGNAQTVDLLNKYEIHVLPVLNPDGYEFSHEKTRLWRKNRAKNGVLSLCPGVDLNRNFDYKWKEGGSSDVTCADNYAGPKGNSEPETQALISALNANAGNWDAYYSIHSYGQWWLLPWGHDPTDVAPNYSELYDNGMIGAAAIKDLYNSTFTVGSSSALLYVTTGSSADYAYGALNIKFSATLELRPGNGTADFSYGFELPEERLPQVTEETWAGIKASMLDVSKRRP